MQAQKFGATIAVAKTAVQFVCEGDGGYTITRAPLLLETSRPRVFAVGDIRSGSVKRVASAVGEGSICVQLVHQVLGT